MLIRFMPSVKSLWCLSTEYKTTASIWLNNSCRTENRKEQVTKIYLQAPLHVDCLIRTNTRGLKKAFQCFVDFNNLL